jgi:hypothetical protein
MGGRSSSSCSDSSFRRLVSIQSLPSANEFIHTLSVGGLQAFIHEYWTLTSGFPFSPSVNAAVAIRFGIGKDFFINCFLCICGCEDHAVLTTANSNDVLKANGDVRHRYPFAWSQFLHPEYTEQVSRRSGYKTLSSA